MILLFFYNYFSSLDLLSNLKDKFEILSLGTFRGNRIGGCPLDSVKVFEKKTRVSYAYKMEEEKGVIVVKWRDNKCVLLGSTFIGIHPESTLKRYCKVNKKKVDVACPSIIKQYNKHMGGVDKANSLLGLYRTPGRARR